MMVPNDVNPGPGKYLVRRAEAGGITDGGLALPEVSRPKLDYGIVLAAGKGAEIVPPGAIVYFMGAAALDIEPICDDGTPGGEKLWIVHEETVLAWSLPSPGVPLDKLLHPAGTAPDRDREKEQRKRIEAR